MRTEHIEMQPSIHISTWPMKAIPVLWNNFVKVLFPVVLPGLSSSVKYFEEVKRAGIVKQQFCSAFVKCTLLNIGFWDAVLNRPRRSICTSLHRILRYSSAPIYRIPVALYVADRKYENQSCPLCAESFWFAVRMLYMCRKKMNVEQRLFLTTPFSSARVTIRLLLKDEYSSMSQPGDVPTQLRDLWH